MSTPESTTETSDLDTAARAKQDTLTQSVGTPLAARPPEGKMSWLKRLFGRG